MGGIAISFEPGLDLADSKVSATGRTVRPPTGDELGILGFDLDDVTGIYDGGQGQRLTEWARGAGYNEPPNQYRLARLGDRYGRQDWSGRNVAGRCRPAMLTIDAAGPGKIDRITLQPKLVDHQIFGPSDVATTGKAELAGTVSTSLEVGFAVTVEDAISVEVNVEAGIGPVKGGGGTSISESVSTEHSTSRSRTEDVSSSSALEFEVPTGEIIAAVLTLSRGDITATVPVRARLTGDVLLGDTTGDTGAKDGIWGYPLEDWPPARAGNQPGNGLAATYLVQIASGIYGAKNSRAVRCRTASIADVEAAAGTDKAATQIYP